MLTANTMIDFSTCITAPSIAVKALKGITENIEDVIRLNGPAKEFITQSYYGGRCEAAYPKMREGTHYDINSMYAAAFCLPMPTGIPNYFLLEQPIPWADDSFQQLIDGKIGFIEVGVKLSIDVIEANPILAAHPLLPLRTTERIISPTGSWQGIYTTAELKLAHSLGYEITIHSGYVFDVDDTLFHSFISKFYNMRQAAKMNKNKALDQVSKLIMNSAYGRFALGTDPSLVTITCSADELTLIQFYFNTIEVHKIGENEFQVDVYLGLDEQALESIKESGDETFFEIDGNVEDQRRQDYRDRISQASRDAKADDFKVERNIAIASIITSYARCLLYTYLIANPATVYMDTDSVMAARSLNPDDISSTKLGKMKLENTIKMGAFAAPKLYSYETVEGDIIFKGKGIDKKSQKRMGVENIIGCIDRNEPIKSESTQWRRDQNAHTITTVEVEKQFSGANLKRVTVVDDETNEVIAFLPLDVRAGAPGESFLNLTTAKRVLESDLRKDPHFSRLLDVYNSVFKAEDVEERTIRSASEFAIDYTPKTFNQESVMMLEPFNFNSYIDSDFMYSTKGEQGKLPQELQDQFDELVFNSALLKTRSFRDFIKRNEEEVRAGKEGVENLGPAIRRLRSIYPKYFRYLSSILSLSKQIDVGAIPAYSDSEFIKVHDDFETVYAAFNGSTVVDTLSLGRAGSMGQATIGTLEELRGFYSELEERISKIGNPPGELEQMVFEKWCSDNHQLVGNIGLKFDVFITSCYFAKYSHLHAEFIELFDFVRYMVLDRMPLTKDELVELYENSSSEEFTELINLVLQRAFGIRDREHLMSTSGAIRPTEALSSFLSGSSIALPMISPPVAYNLTNPDESLVEGSIMRSSPYDTLSTRPIHASFGQLNSVISHDCQTSMNKASSTALVVAPNAGWVGNPTAIKYEVEFGNVARLEQVQNIHSMLRAYKGRTFYCPAFLDYRGRMYYYGSFLQPQSINLSRAHIESAQQGMIPASAIAYIAMFAASESGASGSSQIVKVQSFISTLDTGLRIGEQIPMSDGINFEYVMVVRGVFEEMGLDLSGFWGFLQIIEMMQRFSVSRDARSGMFIYSDAAQSGSQIISMLTNDAQLGEAVNIGIDQTLATFPKDYYSSIVNDIKARWEEITEGSRDRMRLLFNAYTRSRGEVITNEEVEELVKRVNRKFVKRNVMTIAYNLTLYGAVGQLVDDLGTEITVREAAILAVLIRSAVQAKFPSLANFIEI
jgi:DNA polymerase type B, organellar and viral/DNA-dependent RNA polymerase